MKTEENKKCVTQDSPLYRKIKHLLGFRLNLKICQYKSNNMQEMS